MKARPEMTAAWAADEIQMAAAFDPQLDVVSTGITPGESTFEITFAQGRKTKSFKVTVEELTEGGSDE